MVEKITRKTGLYYSFDNINQSIVQSNEAKDRSESAIQKAGSAEQTANTALGNSESTQDQLDTIVIESGTSDAEVLQARTNNRGKTFDVLRDYLNALDIELRERAVNVKWYGASGSYLQTKGSINAGSNQLNVVNRQDFNVGQGIAIESAGPNSVKEIASLQITAGATTNGYVIIVLDGASASVDILAGDSAVTIADKIRNTSFSGWTTGGTVGTDTVTFTADTYGDKLDATFVPDAGTGVSGAMITTTQGMSVPLVSVITSISSTAIELRDTADTSVNAESVRHDDTQALKDAFDLMIDRDLAIYIPHGFFNTSSPIDITRKNSNGVAGSQYGKVVFGQGYHSTIVYYPPENATNQSAPNNGYAAGALNGGNDGRNFVLRNFRIIRGGPNRNNACGLKFHKVYQSVFENIRVEGFEVGIHMNYNWSNAYRDNKLYDNGVGLLLDNMTINEVENNDIKGCGIGILYGWNITGTNTDEPELYSQGMTLISNTIQECSECAIFGYNTQVTNIFGIYTEDNCGTESFSRINDLTNNQTDLNGCEIIIYSNNVVGNSFVKIEGNWFWQNQHSNQSPLGLKDVAKVKFKSNSVYGTAYSQGPTAINIVTLGNVSAIDSDVIIRGGVYDSERFYRNAAKTIDHIPVSDLVTQSISIPSNSTKIVVTPISIMSPNVTNEIKVDSDMSSLNGISFKAGIYSGWESKLINSFSGSSQSGTLDTGKNTITIPFGETITVPRGLQWIAIEINNTTGSAVDFSYLTKTGFDYTRGDIASSILNGAFNDFSSANRLNVSSVVQPFSINVSG